MNYIINDVHLELIAEAGNGELVNYLYSLEPVGATDHIGDANKMVEPINEWTVIAPDGTRFTGPTPLKAAFPASKYRLEIDPVAAEKFAEVIEQIREEGEKEHDECMEKAQTAKPGDIRALKHRIHELEGEVIGYKQILDGQATPPQHQAAMKLALEALRELADCGADAWSAERPCVKDGYAAIAALEGVL